MRNDLNIDERVNHLHSLTKRLLQENESEDVIVNKLMQEDIDENYARLIIANVQNDIYDRRQFWKLLAKGLFITIGGLWINYFSYSQAIARGALIYYVFWGIVVMGIIVIIKAFTIFGR